MLQYIPAAHVGDRPRPTELNDFCPFPNGSLAGNGAASKVVTNRTWHWGLGWKKGWCGASSAQQRCLHAILTQCPTTAGSVQFCLLCCQPEPVPRSLAARRMQFTLLTPCRLPAWLGRTIHMTCSTYYAPIHSSSPCGLTGQEPTSNPCFPSAPGQRKRPRPASWTGKKRTGVVHLLHSRGDYKSF